MKTRTKIKAKMPQEGAALAVALIILLVITVLAIAGMKATRISVLQAGNKQYKSQTFEAANAGVQVQYVDVANFSTAWTVPSNQMSVAQQGVTAVSNVVFTGTGPVPPSLREFSSDGLFVSQNYEIDSIAQHPQSGAYVQIRQGVYNIAPGTSK